MTGSAASMASSCGPKVASRCSTKRRSARSPSVRVAGNRRGPSRPTKETSPSRSQRSRSWRTSSSMSSSRGRYGRPTWRRRPRGAGFPVVVIEVPPSRRGLLAVHEQAVPAADPAVEVLLPQALAAVTLGPGGEAGHRHEEAAGGPHCHLGQGAHQAQSRVRGGVVDADRAPARGPGQSLTVGVGAYVRDAVARFGRAVAHGGQHQVGLGPVETPPPEDGARLDHEQRSFRPGPLFARREEVGAELVAEEPMHDASPQSRPRACLNRASPSASSTSGSG